MAIDINRLGSNQVQGSNADGVRPQVARSEPTLAQQQTGKPSSADTVMLTDTASRMRSLEKVVANMPVIDSQRVENIRKALNEGTYNISGDEVAGKLLVFESRLNQTTVDRAK